MNIRHFCTNLSARAAAIIMAAMLPSAFACAQTFTQKVQQHTSGQGMVTIHHDADIDRLVNSKAPATVATPAPKTEQRDEPVAVKHNKAEAPKPKAEKPKAEKPKAEKPKAEKPKAEKPKAEKPKAEKPKAEKPKQEKPKSKPQSDTTRSKPQTDTTRSETNGLPVDTPATTPIVPIDTVGIPFSGPRHGYKTTGYRVQAFAGGNTRRDRQRAEQTGNAMRQLFPGEDVYVRFYSPRWVCRVGNYRTYEEAHEKMVIIRKMGYESATIVKGKIIVYNQ